MVHDPREGPAIQHINALLPNIAEYETIGMQDAALVEASDMYIHKQGDPTLSQLLDLYNATPQSKSSSPGPLRAHLVATDRSIPGLESQKRWPSGGSTRASSHQAPMRTSAPQPSVSDASGTAGVGLRQPLEEMHEFFGAEPHLSKRFAPPPSVTDGVSVEDMPSHTQLKPPPTRRRRTAARLVDWTSIRKYLDSEEKERQQRLTHYRLSRHHTSKQLQMDRKAARGLEVSGSATCACRSSGYVMMLNC